MSAYSIMDAGAPERAVLDKTRAQILVIVDQIKALRGAPLAHEETRARIVVGLEGAIYERSPENKFFEIQAGADGAGRFDWPASTLAGAVIFDLNQFGFADLAWLFGPEAVADMVMKRLKDRGPAPGLAAAARTVRLAELNAERVRLELAEEAEILKLEAAGHVVLRRADMDPALVLSKWLDHERAMAQ
jgi:hypothetical protein